MKNLLSAFLLLSSALVLGNDFFDQYEALKKAGDEAAIVAFLEESAAEQVENPDYYAASGNYWWGVAGQINISPLPAGEFELTPDGFEILDPETGKKVGTLGKAGDLRPELSNRALKMLSDGAAKFPHRADLALGLAHVQKEMGLSEGYVTTLTTLLATAKKDPAALKWMKNGALPGPPETFLPETAQTYTGALFNANTPATDALCAKLLSAVVAAFPEHPYAYNMKAALAAATGKPEEAFKSLEIAHQKSLEDPLILANLAECYAKRGQKKKAVKSYQKLLKLEIEPATRAAAEQALAELRK